MYELLPWISFVVFIIAMITVDLLIFNKKAHEITIKESLLWSCIWIALALLFNVYVYYSRGSADALNFLTAYLVEKSLSVDNLFIFLLIFHYFKTPSSSQHKVLFYGILSAIILRAVFIWLGIAIITKFHWMIYVFGAFLVFTGIKFAFEKDKKVDPSKNPILKLFRYFFPMTDRYEKDRFFVRHHSRILATPLVAVLIAIETTDVIFAVDSIPAVLAITFDPYIVFTSNIFAILGLRSLFFALSGIMSLFHYLHYGLAFILIFIGFKMLSAEFYHISNLTTFLCVFFALGISIIMSLLYPQK